VPADIPQFESHEPAAGALNAAITRAVVQIHRSRAGRGPTEARAFFNGSTVVVVLHDFATAAERTLVADGREEMAYAARRALHESMRPELTAAVERLSGRRVEALLSDIDFARGVAAEVFVLDASVEDAPAG
jgi:uncharacterized protein YbcI